MKTLSLIVLLCALLFPLNLQAEETVASPLSLAWVSRAQDLQNVLDEASDLQKAAQQIGGPLAANLKQVQNEIARFFSLYQASRHHPTEQLTLLLQMQGLKRQLQNSVQPLEDIDGQIDERLQEVAQLKQDIADFANLGVQRSASGDDASQQELEQQAAYIASLENAQKQLTGIDNRINKVLGPIKITLQRLHSGIDDIEKNLLGVWQDYYFTPAGGNLDILNASVGASAGILNWLSSLPSRFLLAYPHNLDDWLYVGSRFALHAIIMGMIGFFAYRAARKLPKRWQTPVYDIIHRGWIWVSLGWALLAAGRNSLGGIYFTFVIIGVLVLIWGLASLSWRLRVAAKPNLTGMPSPMARLFVPAAIGVLLLYSDLPPKILLVMWAVIMLGFAIWLRSGHLRAASKGVSLLERISYGGAMYFAIISLIIALSGYARLAILFYMTLFALVNVITLGNALSNLSIVIVNKVMSQEHRPVMNAIIRSLAIPGTWIVSLLCAMPWIWAIPGAIYLLRHFLNTDYTIGEASFDFSKIIFITVLFFLFRSFVSLSKTSLTHLPDRMPQLERGVIPPLRSLTGYLLWLIFAVIALSMLGVNFTSLAVVAGGLSVGIGFGMQNLFNNLISGLMLIFGRTVLVGDFVEVGGVSGVVRAVNIRSVLIETPEHAEVFIPNSNIIAGQFTNWTRSERMVRRTVSVGVAYGSDVQQVMSILREIPKTQPHVLESPAPIISFSDFASSTLNFSLMVYIDDLNNVGAVLTGLRVAIEQSFRENNINIAFPQLDVHLHGQDSLQPNPGSA